MIQNNNLKAFDKLDAIFGKQMYLQLKLKQKFNQEYININSLALIDEVMETLRESPWKPWKKNQVLNQENFKKELVDALHFFVNLCLAVGMTSNELFDLYVKKNEVNHERQKNGY